MNWLKKILDRIFIEGLSGMAYGLFATLIVGTIIQQIGTLVGGQTGNLLYAIGKVAAALTSAGIGVGVAYRFKASSLVVLSAATAGMVGGFASKLLAGTVLDEGAMVFAGRQNLSGIPCRIYWNRSWTAFGRKTRIFRFRRLQSLLSAPVL